VTETASEQAEGQTRTQPGSQTVPVRFLAIMSTVFVGWSLAFGAIPAALVVGLVPGGWWMMLGAWLVLVLVPLVILVRGFRVRAYPSSFVRLFAMRPFWYVQMGLPLVAIPSLVAWLVGLPFGQALAWGRFVALAMVALVALFYAAGYWGAQRLVVRKLTITFPDLPEGLHGMTIAQLSDHHVGPHTNRSLLRRAVAAVEREKPDIIVHTGDQVDDYHQDVDHFVKAFGALKAPLGVYAIAGNHDVYAGWPGVRAGMEAAGMRVLVNDAEPVKRGAGEVWVVGTGDPAGAQSFGGYSEVAPDVDRAMSRVPAGAFSLVLAHNPALWPALAAKGARLTLSGHTHHGQLSIPALKWSLASPFLDLSMGEYERGASRLYIHPGTNHWGLPMRIGAWPEVAIITLTRGDPSSARGGSAPPRASSTPESRT
jgi:uncharacterized protein